MRKKFVTLVLSFLMMSCVFAGSKITASAASFSVYGTRADGPGQQLFVVTNSGEASSFTWDAGGYGSGSFSLGAGQSTTISVPTNDYVTVIVTAEDSTQNAAVSVNEYPVTIYANYGGSRQVLQTTVINMSQGTLSYSVDQRVTIGGQLYECSNPTQYLYYGEGSSLEFVYNKVAQPDKYIDVYFVDDRGYMLASDTFSVSAGTTASYSAPASLSANGKTYNLASSQQSVSHRYDSTKTSYSFTYKAEAQTPSKPYSVSVSFIDSATGKVIAAKSMTIPVNSSNTLSIPATYVSGTTTYKRAGGQPSEITHTAGDSTRSYEVYFDPTDEKLPYSITINFADAVTGKSLKTVKEDVPVNSVVTYDLPSSIKSGSTNYLLASGQSNVISHDYNNSKRNYTVYYNAEGSSQSGYEIGIQYVDVKTNNVLFKDSRSVASGKNVSFNVPSEYTADGKEFVLLSGQSKSVTHRYDSTRRNYILYFRDINDKSNENTVVEEETYTQIITDEGETITVPNVVTTIISGEGGETTVDENGNVVTIPDEAVPVGDADLDGAEDGQNEENEDNENPEESSESLTNIEDETVPLAKGENLAGSQVNMPLIIGLSVAGLAVIAGLIYYFVFFKKKAHKNDAE